MDADTLLDVLLQLEHDLGKYLRLPIVMLPREADQGELREALSRALLRTRVKDGVGVPAKEIWAGFRAELSAAGGSERLEAVETSVVIALDWETKLDKTEELDRAAIERDMASVGQAVRVWIEELRGG